MKSTIKIWMMAIVIGLYFGMSPWAHAASATSWHIGQSGLLPKPSLFQLSDSELASAKAVFMAHVSVTPKNESSNTLNKVSLLKIEDIYHAVISNPFDVIAWNNLGHRLFDLDHYEEALAAYDHALLIDPDYSLILANRCGVLSILGEYGQALESCDLAIKKDQKWGRQGAAIAWDNQGDALFNLERYQESLESFEIALLINPNYQNAKRNREIVQYQLGQISGHL